MAVIDAENAAGARCRRLLRGAARAFALLLARDAHAYEEVLDIGLVVNLDGRSVTVFDQAPLQVRSVIALPDSVLPLGGAICERDDGALVGAVADAEGYVHVVDVLAGRRLARVEVGINAVDVSCCGDHLVVTGGVQFGEKQPPAVVDLRRMVEVPQSAPLQQAMAGACAASRDRVLLASANDERIYRLALDRASGQLSDAGVERTASGPVDVEVAPDQRCASVVEDAPGLVTAYAFPRLSGGGAAALPNALSLVDACHGDDYVAVRSTFGAQDRLQTFDIDGRCVLAPTPRFERTVGPLVIAQLPGVDSMGCARSGLIFVAEDGDETTSAGDAVRVYTAHGQAVGELRHPSIDGPIGIAVFHRRSYAVPAADGGGLGVLAAACAAAAAAALRRRRGWRDRIV